MTSFDDDKQKAAIVCRHVHSDGSPILYASRAAPVEPADSGWQFLCGADEHAATDARVWSMREVVRFEPSLRRFMDAPVGTVLGRADASGEWSSALMRTRCCRLITGNVRDVRSPFSRLIAVGYYDGPTDGVVECGWCKATYWFEKLDWDDWQNVRVFSIAPVVCDGLDDLANISGAAAPRWPSWALVGAIKPEFSAKLEALRQSATERAFVVATRDLLVRLDVWRPFGLGAHGDWFTELALDRRGSAS